MGASRGLTTEVSLIRAIAVSLRGLMVRTHRGPLRFLWRACYGTTAALACFVIRRAAPGCAIVLRGSLASGEPVYGLSDIDLVVVVSGPDEADQARRLNRRLNRLYRAAPILKDIVEVSILSRTSLERAVTAPFQAWPPVEENYRYRGSVRPDGGAIYYGPLRIWKTVSGPEPLDGVVIDSQRYWQLWALLELRFIWKHWFRVCANPVSPHFGWFSLKSAAMMARLAMWLEEGYITSNRRTALERAIRAIPEEAESFRRALVIWDKLDRKQAPEIAEVSGLLARLTRRVADRIAASASTAAAVRLRLAGTSELGRELPLLDWRGIALAASPEDVMAPAAGSLSDPESLGRLARAARPGRYPAFIEDGVLALPTNVRGGLSLLSASSLRTLHLPVSDPVAFALLRGEETCEFRELPGWSLASCAKRAVAEHRIWLRHEEQRERSDRRRLAMLFSAARAVLLLDSLADGEPELAVTVRRGAASLGERYPGARDAARRAEQEYARAVRDGVEPDAGAVARLGAAVRQLPAYRDPVA